MLVLFVLAIALSAAQTPARLQQEIDALNRDPDLVHGVWSLCVQDVDSGTVIAENKSQTSVQPASTLKIFTTAAALGELGVDYRYETRIESSGAYDSLTGELHGNLYVRGSGDPTLDSRYFRKENDSTTLQRWAAQLYRKGLRKIDGAVFGDVSAFDANPLPDGWSWGDMGQYYGAQACALAYHDNSYSLYFDSDAHSAKLIKTNPVVNDLKLDVHVEADGTKDEAFIYGAPFGNTQSVSGSIPPNRKNYEVEAALPDPALQCARDLVTALTNVGIVVSKATTTRLQAEVPSNAYRLWLTHRSPPLSEIVYWTNLKSDNVYAEQLLRTLTLKKGLPRDAAYTQAVQNYWKAKGLDLTAGFFMMDGSGLSRSNVLTTRLQAEALRIIAKEKYYTVFYASLPVAGKTGSLASVGKGTSAEGVVHAKSGYITRARGYAGYAQTKGGKQICFSLLANNYTCTPTQMKKKLERILIALAELN